MAEALKDIRTKVRTRTWCFLESESRATGKDQAEVVREILEVWSDIRLHAAIEAQKLLAAEGEPGIAQGSAGHRRA